MTCVCVVHVCVSVCTYVSGVDTESAQDQPAMTDWRRLPSCVGCSFVVSLCARACVYFSVCISAYLLACVCMCVWWWKTGPGLVWALGKITVSVHVCVAGPVADVVQTWTFAGDCCLHIYLHDCVCVYLRVCVRTCVDWDGDSPKSTSEGCLTETICLTDGTTSLSFSFCISASSWSYVQAEVGAVFVCAAAVVWVLCAYVGVLAVVESTQKQLRQQTWQTAGNHILLHISHALA